MEAGGGGGAAGPPAGPPAEAEEHGDLILFAQPDESAGALLARCAAERLATGCPLVDAHAALRPGQLFEVLGPAASGKTSVLAAAAVRFLVAQVARAVEHGAAPPPRRGTQAAPIPPPPQQQQRPTSLQPTSPMGGAEGFVCQHVLVVDLDGKFDALRVVQAVIQQLEEGLGLAVRSLARPLARFLLRFACRTLTRTHAWAR
jgi:hypothetical protein